MDVRDKFQRRRRRSIQPYVPGIYKRPTRRRHRPALGRAKAAHASVHTRLDLVATVLSILLAVLELAHTLAPLVMRWLP